MQDKELVRMLAMYGYLLNGHTTDDIVHELICEEERNEILSFAELVQQLREALAPIKPAPSFKRELERKLMDAALQRMYREVRIALPSQERSVLIGAAVGSAVALAGGVAYLVRSWIRGRSQRVGQVGS